MATSKQVTMICHTYSPDENLKHNKWKSKQPHNEKRDRKKNNKRPA